MKQRMRSGRRVGEVEKLCFFILFGNTTKQSAFPFYAITPSAKRHVAIPPRPVQKPIMFAVTQRAVSVAPLCRTSAAPKRRASFVVRAGEVESSGSSYYTVVKGVKLDRKVVDDCVAFEKNDGSIDLQEAERIFADIVDGPSRAVGGSNETETTVTNVELDTAQYVFDNFKWEQDAKDWFFKELTSKNW